MGFKKILFVLLFGLFFLPMFQYVSNSIEISPLAGVALEEKPRPTITINSWFDASYQEATNTYFDQFIGFRPWFIKLVNQVDYTLLDHTEAPGVVVGKEDYLFIESYILDYTGANYVGEEKIKSTVEALSEVSRYLDENGISLLVVFAPGKASFFPEFIPDKYHPDRPKKSNYKQYSTQFKSSGIRFIDFNDYFIQQKENFPYPIYSKVGTHWSSYGKSVALDSMMAFIEKDRKIDLPDFLYNSVELSDSLVDTDWDIEEQMNLIWPIEHEAMPYPKYHFIRKNKTKPNAIVIGDSYWWCMVADQMPKEVFQEDDYWFYFKDRHIQNVKQETPIAQIDIAEQLMSQDLIVLMATEATMHLFPYGFADRFKRDVIDMNSYLEMSFEEKVQYWEIEIRKDPKWLKSIQEKALSNGISIEEMLHLDAVFITKQKEQ